MRDKKDVPRRPARWTSDVSIGRTGAAERSFGGTLVFMSSDQGWKFKGGGEQEGETS